MSALRIARFMIVGSLMVLPVPAGAQTGVSGTIAGVVRDTSGAVLPGVTVEAASPALIEKIRTVVTDDQGQYKIVELRPGTYAVSFSLAGFNTIRREGLELTAGFTATVNADLQVGALAETITVTGATPVVDVQSTRTQKVLSRTVLDAIPAAKTFNTYVALIPGVTNFSSISRRDVGGTAGEPPFGLRVHGSDSGLTTIDGIVALAMETPSIHKMNPNAVAIQETVVETGNGSAEAWSGGVNVNIVSKDGGNTFNGTMAADYSGKGLDFNNLNDELRARGLTQYNKQKRLYDLGAGFGGPLKKDRLWFYSATRAWATYYYVAGIYYNKTPHTLFYEPDLSRQATFGRKSYDVSGRVTWQAALKHKFLFQINNGSQCFCQIGPAEGTDTPEGGRHYYYGPQRLGSVTWTHPATSRLLWEAGAAYRQDYNHSEPIPEVLPTDRSVFDTTLGLEYGSDFSASVGPNWTGAYQKRTPGGQTIARGSMSYVSGSHAFKTGFTTLSGFQIMGGALNYPERYVFRSRVPLAIDQAASPNRLETRVNLLGVYAQDQWTVRRLTLNLGARFDYINGHSPAQVRPAGEYLPEIPFEAAHNIPNWKNIHPRLGAAYDLLGNGKTALKVSLGRYEQSNNFGLIFPRLASPVGELILLTTRTWNDANRDYVPDCDLHSKAANGECGAMANQNFGSRVAANRYADDVKQGWGVSPHLWQSQVSLQHELAANVGLTVGYFRTWWGNIYMTDNLKVTPADFDPYCITAPTDVRLPGAGGYQVCNNLFDISRARFGQSDNLITLAPDRSQNFNGVDVLLNARFTGGRLISGGLSTGKTVIDNCATPDVPEQFCRQTTPWRGQTEIKFSGVYPLPWWGLQASATLQNLSGTPQSASYVASNAEIVPSLGRNLSACANTTGPCNATAIVNLIEPLTMFEGRETQIDVRLSKIFRFGRTRLAGNVDVYNLTNTGSVLNMQTRYGAEWLKPLNILAGRFIKFSAQVDF